MIILSPPVRCSLVRRFFFSSFDESTLEKSTLKEPFSLFRRTAVATTSLLLILTFLSISGRAQADDSETTSPTSAAETALPSGWGDRWFGALVPNPQPNPGEFPPSVAHSQLSALSWLVGCWEWEANGLVFQTKIDWAPGGAYLVCRDFVRPFAPVDSVDSTRSKSPVATSAANAPSTNALAESPAFAALRIVGWNPVSELFQSSIFCRDGSSGSAIWQESDGVWTVSTQILLADGRGATAVDFIRPLSPSGFVWEARSRTIENVPLPNLGPAEARPLSPLVFRQNEPTFLPEPAAAATAE